jgi:hypothetical protein
MTLLLLKIQDFDKFIEYIFMLIFVQNSKVIIIREVFSQNGVLLNTWAIGNGSLAI